MPPHFRPSTRRPQAGDGDQTTATASDDSICKLAHETRQLGFETSADGKKMNTRKENLLNRFSDLLDNGMGCFQDAAEDLQSRLRKDRRTLARKARKGFSEGKDRALSAEETIVRTIRDNPTIFAVIALVLIGLLVGRMLIVRQPPLDEEW